MRYSELFGKTLREAPRDEESKNAQLLARGGYVNKLMSGVYTFLPLGTRVLTKIENIVREEMAAIGGQEILMPTMQPKENWVATGRWDDFDVLYKVKSPDGREVALGPTHEEVVAPLAKQYVQSYKDLPLYLYQIQTKFRDELRAKNGLLRGREFRMKDLYSFHSSVEDLEAYYEKAKQAYAKIFDRVGLKALLTEASGGTFSKYSHEFQVQVESGEDVLYHCSKCSFCQNKEIVSADLDKLKVGEAGVCPKCGENLEVVSATEVGNIFQLKNKYSDPFKLTFLDSDGQTQTVMMGCYGIGTSRLMGTIAEVLSDEKGLRWPEEVAPYKVHLVSLGKSMPFANEVYHKLVSAGVEVLYDERDCSAGVKLGDADLVGLPLRVVVSDKTAAENKVELKARNSEEVRVISIDETLEILVK
ncbi:MAG: hypothetical protein A3F33_00155 [Candidatus Woykebacteria bacterium RIFCSPHIGHO2_12_FULL_43_10]|uniref:Proline--tRNA ligase n=2 Tax=Candidatus Woykeibacteriota TaxID=1817899 RepID=A0A1G1WVY5_9BACT|nr:MAG: hypothetical protein A2802_02055 [Candidatus Woykebacteria bacterium RIFCSPHIGHO2_01_FULL_43_29]OGY28840.1 MAG: hypothetical protein A3F33_00155 [Candidatus Woykebacteria bacterium RIFCSPHIGHO2_12_FULL_43_10]OGY30201.1 MAG: hypothetical protein A3J50_01985 [Candidatus Woykebacteria bacterium RIFCSPHIGHO2_02_FULL_43_16b]OGY31863.1 MAG: hypothetical protein A3A61_03050 [Candidatus Woykebacteria bacterium RIFCSPLOWO2_01_FULL_43_14]